MEKNKISSVLYKFSRGWADMINCHALNQGINVSFKLKLDLNS